MAMEDAVALANALTEHQEDLPAALAAYEAAAQPSVRGIQDSARPSLAWWEHFGRYHDHFAPWQFGYHFFTRSISDARLARRAPEFVAGNHAAWRAEHGAEPLESALERPGLTLPGRSVDVVWQAEVPVGAGGLALHDTAPSARPWAARLEAPPDEEGLPEAIGRLARLADGDPAFVAVYAGNPLTRVLLCEQARMHHKVPALLVDPALDRDGAITAVLSGRADLVGPLGESGS
jgi:anthraniloyl-CoA monooxygenase